MRGEAARRHINPSHLPRRVQGAVRPSLTKRLRVRGVCAGEFSGGPEPYRVCTGNHMKLTSALQFRAVSYVLSSANIYPHCRS